MCRLAAYRGPARPLEDIVIRPDHSLLNQSTQADEAKLAVHGDGFGMAWYGADTEPGLYRSAAPAWSNGNLVSLCRHLRSHLFLAHVRASTEGETAHANCHPFVQGAWSFMHNGQIGHFARLRRGLEARLPDRLYTARRGTTDSEAMFLLLLDAGLEDDPQAAVAEVIRVLYAETKAQGLKPFLRLTCVFSNGHRLFGFRHATDGQSPTLYLSDRFCTGGIALASEPLDGNPSGWHPVDADRLCILSDSGDDQVALPLAA